MAPTWIILVLVWATFVRCRQATAIVDGSDPRITYSDNAQWYWIASSSSCDCTTSMGLDPSQLNEGTWNAGINTVSASFAFDGTGVDVFSAFRNTLDTVTNVTFVLDGQTQGAFVQSGQASDWKYKYNAFTASNLTEGKHELIIQGGTTSFFVLDYMTITYTESPPKSVVGPISGSIIGFCALVIAIVVFLWRRGYFEAPAVPNSRDYSEAIRGFDDASPVSSFVAPTGLVTTKRAEVKATNAAVTITCFKGLAATAEVVSARMTALVARNLKYGVHPFIIPVVGFAYVDRNACLISAPVDTTELGEYIADLSRADRLSLVLDVCEGLQHLHKCGIVHSDLKPSNIVINKEGRAMLRGYGAAGIAGRNAGELYEARYSAPEILDKAKFNFRSDVFSLGRVILFIMTGKPPYVKLKDDSAVILAQLDGLSPDRNNYKDGLGGEKTDELWAWLVCCWNPDPQQRPRMSQVARYFFEDDGGSEDDDDNSGPEDGDVEEDGNPDPEDGDEWDDDDTQLVSMGKGDYTLK